MSYDYGVKHISKHTGLTGVESKNIIKGLLKQDLDYDLFDWKTIGQDLYGHGKKTKGVKHHLKKMYGIDLDLHGGSKAERQKYSEMEVHNVMNELMMINERRSPQAKMMDISKSAKRTFHPSDKIGVALWKKNPNRIDIIGIDDPIKL